MQGVPCLLLRYSEPLAGARYLARAIEEADTRVLNQASLLNVPAHYSTQLHSKSALNSSLCDDKTQQYVLQNKWVPQQNISSYPLGEELFLIHNSTGAIHRLNSSGKIAWLLLQQTSLSGHTLTHLVADYFQVSINEVTLDISTLMIALAHAGLISVITLDN